MYVGLCAFNQSINQSITQSLKPVGPVNPFERFLTWVQVGVDSRGLLCFALPSALMVMMYYGRLFSAGSGDGYLHGSFTFPSIHPSIHTHTYVHISWIM